MQCLFYASEDFCTIQICSLLLLLLVVTRVCVCLSVRDSMPILLHGPGCNLGNGRGCPLVVHYLADLQFIIVVWSKFFMLQQGWTWVMGQLFTTQPDLPDAESMVNPIHMLVLALCLVIIIIYATILLLRVRKVCSR